MKLPLGWLKEFVSLRADASDLAQHLTGAGLEVEGIETVEGEPVLEINVTPNRGDCLSVIGLAREAAALYGISLKVQKNPPLKRIFEKPSVTVREARRAPRYLLAVVEGIRVKESPDWMIRRLKQMGYRPINNVVDSTNYVLAEYGQPLHAFDRSRVSGKIEVRKAKPGEKILTLDGEERELIPSDLVIADENGPIALAGIIGGKDSEVDGGTTSVALECAWFEPSGIRRTAKRLGLQTESSYRFERRVDPEGVKPALLRAIALLSELGGGTCTGLFEKTQRFSSSSVSFRPTSVAEVLGGSWTVGTIRKILNRLGFYVKVSKLAWTVKAPSWRGDISRSVDLIEEVSRLGGLDRIPTTFPICAAAPASAESSREWASKIRHLLASLGVQETIHLSFASPSELEPFEETSSMPVVLKNPFGVEDSCLRTSLLPALLKTVSFHQRHKLTDVRFFEMRPVFESVGGRVREFKKLAAAFSGSRLNDHWGDHVGGRQTEADFYDARGIVEKILEQLNGSGVFKKSTRAFLHPGKQADVIVAGRVAGCLGEVHPDIQEKFDLKKRVTVLDLDWEILLSGVGAVKSYRPYSMHPLVQRDLAVVLEEAVEAASVMKFISDADPAVREVMPFDVYRGVPIPEGKKSLAFSIQIGLNNKTLTDGEVSEIFGRILKGIAGEFRAEVR